MDENLHLLKHMDKVESMDGRMRDSLLLHRLTEAIRGLQAVTRGKDHVEQGRGVSGEEAGGRLSPTGGQGEDEGRGTSANGERAENECKQGVLGVLRELGVFHSDRMTAWGQVVREGAHMLAQSPSGARHQQQLSATDTECRITSSSDPFSDTFQSVGEDIENIMDKLNAIITKLDEEILKVCPEETSNVDAAELQETRDSRASEEPGDNSEPLNSNKPLQSDPAHQQDVEEDGDSQRCTMASPDIEQTSDPRWSGSDCNDMEETLKELVVKNQGSDNEESDCPDRQTDILEEKEEDTKEKGKEETNTDWITVGLTGQQEDSLSGVPDACFIRAPTGLAGALRCELADTLSCLMVSGLEELVSRVVRVKVQEGINFPFPVTLVLPFCARYRGNYRDVAVKMVDDEKKRASYITPVTTEGTYGGQRGSFAEVRVYSLGLFAVVSCLRRENYTVPTKGLSLKLPMDPRICLNYLPGSFTVSVMAQTMIQPLDAVLVAAVKSRSEAHHPLVSTSPLLYLTHPSYQPLRRPLTLTLPCPPPNPESKRHTRGQGEQRDPPIQPGSSSTRWDPPASHRRRILGASAKSREISNELLVVLGSRDKQWNVLDKVTVRNQQNGLVSFELTENFDRLLVVALLSPLPAHLLTSLAEELEESVRRHAVTVVVLRHRAEQPRGAVLLAALPSRHLAWELSKLSAQGYGSSGGGGGGGGRGGGGGGGGLPETSSQQEISMCEGDQLLLRFSGNITSTGRHKNQLDVAHGRLTFHSQQKNHLLVQLSEVDPFGNYSSPHYKGTALFYKLTRDQLEWLGDRPAPIDPKLLGEPVCKLSLTLPKKARTINRPITARVKICEETDPLSDSLLLWLSGELSEREVALLVVSLRLRRSAAQLVKLRAGDSLPAQAFNVLAMWRRGLPATQHKPRASQLAHCLAKSGRPDLARELVLRHAEVTTRLTPKQGS